MIRALCLCLVVAVVACAEQRGWRGNLAGDYQQVAACTAELLAPQYGAVGTVRDDQRTAIVASPAREGTLLYEARLQETAPFRIFAEVRQGGDSAPAWPPGAPSKPAPPAAPTPCIRRAARMPGPGSRGRQPSP